MVNNERIVPIQKIDFLSMVGTVLTLNSTSFTVLKAGSVTGEFQVAAAGTYLANQPVKTLNFGAAATSGTIYFVAAFDYAGFKLNGTATETAGADVNPDGITLYKAVLADNTVTISAVTPIISD